MSKKEYNTQAMTLEEAKETFGEPQDMGKWGFKFKKPPSALKDVPDDFFIGFQSIDFPQEVVTYLEERLANFPVSWIGEVTRNGSITASKIESEKLEFITYLTRWVNLMSEVKKGASTHKSIKTKDLEATLELYLLDGKGNKTLTMDLEYCKPESPAGFSGANSPSVMQTGLTVKFDNFYKYLK